MLETGTCHHAEFLLDGELDLALMEKLVELAAFAARQLPESGTKSLHTNRRCAQPRHGGVVTIPKFKDSSE
jgi:hypothetical protein